MKAISTIEYLAGTLGGVFDSCGEMAYVAAIAYTREPI